MALGSLNSFRSPFLVIMTNPSFPGVLVIGGYGVLFGFGNSYYFCGSLSCGSRSLAISSLDHPSKFPPVLKEAKRSTPLCTRKTTCWFFQKSGHHDHITKVNLAAIDMLA